MRSGSECSPAVPAPARWDSTNQKQKVLPVVAFCADIGLTIVLFCLSGGAVFSQRIFPVSVLSQNSESWRERLFCWEKAWYTECSEPEVIKERRGM